MNTQPAPAMTREQFEKAYIQALEESGTSYTPADIAASWRSYSVDPPGHWLSKVTS